MNRIEKRMDLCKAGNEKAFITYMTAGLPDMDKTREVILAQEEAGIDVIELGVPFSDPVADGPVIQNASYQSILRGTTLAKIFDMMKKLRQDGAEVPIVFMMYYNTIYHYGLEKFAQDCISSGVDGVIVPDLPYEEQGELRAALNREDAPILIQLVSPVSRQRIPMIAEDAKGFIYCVSQMGVTGKDSNFHRQIREYLSEVKAVSKVPVMMGFGIRTAADVKPVADIIDGAIVGSQFIRLMEESHYSVDAVKEYIKTFKRELNEAL